MGPSTACILRLESGKQRLRANGAVDIEDHGTSAVQEPVHLQGPGKATPAPGKLQGMAEERDNPPCKHLALTSVASSLDINVSRHQLGASWSILMAAATLFRPQQRSGYFWPLLLETLP